MPCVPCVVEQHLRPEHVGEDELGGAEDRTVDVRLGGEVDDRVAALGRARDRVGVGDVALVELVLDAFEVGAVARVGQLVEHDDVLAVLGQAPHELRADEAGATGDENAHGRSLTPALRCTPPPGQAFAQALAPVRQLRRALLAAQDRVGGARRVRRTPRS